MFIAKNLDAISCHELLHLLHQFNSFCTEFCAVMKQIQNAPKQYETHNLGSNGEDRVCSLQKIPMRLHGTNLCLNCTSSTHFAVPCSNETLPNAPKCYATQQKKSLGSTWLDRVCSLRKIPRRLHGTCALFAPVQPILHQVLCSNERLPNAPKHMKHTKT